VQGVGYSEDSFAPKRGILMRMTLLQTEISKGPRGVYPLIRVERVCQVENRRSSASAVPNQCTRKIIIYANLAHVPSKTEYLEIPVELEENRE